MNNNTITYKHLLYINLCFYNNLRYIIIIYMLRYLYSTKYQHETGTHSYFILIRELTFIEITIDHASFTVEQTTLFCRVYMHRLFQRF